jgi:ATP-dependent RNA helicase DHX37/DHR1
MVRPEVKKKQRQLAEAAKKSHKERKRLEKVILRKKLKVDRSDVLNRLKQVQLPADQLSQLHSTASMQTKGLKRFADEGGLPLHKLSAIDKAEQCLDAAALVKRKRRKIKQDKSSDETSSDDTEAMSTDVEDNSDQEETSPPSRPEGQHISDQTSSKASTLDAPADNIQTKPEPNSMPDADCVQTCDSTKRLEDTERKDHVREPKAIKKEPAVFVPVSRLPDVEKARLELPIIGEEQSIMEKIRYNDIVIISGETGSGKTTQLPQFLYEAGYTLNGKLIGITEPRRVAAITMSQRVAHELNLTDEEVSYQIRFAGNVSDKTQIKFMTDGVLLRECQNDFLLKKYSVIIIDEAHERSVFSDILIGLLSRIVPLRSKKGNPLKLVIMSATLRVTDFTENSFLFPNVPPTIKIDTRQYPVATQFSKKTPPDYLQAAYKKVCSIHNKMPRGGILVFVTSQMDVKALCQKLRKKSLLYCLGLYAMLPLEKQQLVFKAPPEGSRLCVVATNVAETSITIPNIKYVVDTGLEKRKVYDLLTGVSRFTTTWTSKSSAEQRAGRAGRIGPGYCYRLYSSAVFSNDFAEHSEPQILQKPVDDVLLQMKVMNIDNVVNFPFPTRPSTESLKSAEKKLILLGALDDSRIKLARFDELAKTEFSSRPTPLGKAMARFPVSARCSKMIVLSPKDLLNHVICLVSTLTVREMFIQGNQWKELRKKWVGHGDFKLLGDFMLMLRAACFAERCECSNKKCVENGLRTKAMLEVDKLRKQLTVEVNRSLEERCRPETPKAPVSERLKRPSEAQCKVMRQLLLSSFCDHVARKLPDGEIREEKNVNDDSTNQNKKKKLKNAYECMESEEPVYICPESILKGDHHEFIIYKELYKGDKKTYMRDVAVIEPEWLPFYADRLCNFSEKTANENSQMAKYDSLSDQMVCIRMTTYGTLNWPLGMIEVPMHLLNPGVDIYKHFAACLLAGDVIDWFKKYSGSLLSPPSLMTKAWSKLQPRTSKILQALVTSNIKTRKDLEKMWKSDASFMKQEYLAWLPQSMHTEVTQDWEQLLLSVQ